jgi:hypothetical protein
MAIEIAWLKNCIFRRLLSKEVSNIIFFYVYFNGSISDRRNRLIVYSTPTACRTKLYAIATIFNEPLK